MSHLEQKETIKITNPELSNMLNNVPVVDQFLNNYVTHKAFPTQVKVSKSSLMNNANSMQVHR